jgi:general secretion pathway protein G
MEVVVETFLENRMKRNTRGFTLVEILIVVIILGILAAIVIPQFTNASNDARNNSVSSTLQTIRSQIELFKIQHADTPPASTALWTVLGGKTNQTDTTQVVATGTLGPYVQSTPSNPINNKTTFTTAAAAGYGWLYTTSGSLYTFQALDTTGTGVLPY